MVEDIETHLTSQRTTMAEAIISPLPDLATDAKRYANERAMRCRCGAGLTLFGTERSPRTTRTIDGRLCGAVEVVCRTKTTRGPGGLRGLLAGLRSHDEALIGYFALA